jgi:hypothetical protein
MPKKQPTINADLFKRTAPEPQAESTEEKNTPTSVYLTREEKAALDAIAAQIDMTRHAIMQFAIRDFIARYESGEIKPKTETVTRTVLKSE